MYQVLGNASPHPLNVWHLWFVLTFSRQCYNITGSIYLVVCWPKLSINYSIVYSLTIVGRLYYTIWSKSAVGNADCSFKNKYMYCVIYYNFRHTFVPYSTLWPDGVIELAHNCRWFGDLFRWFLHLICWMSAIFLLPVCLTYWPRKYTTRVDPHVDNSRQVWSWYFHPLPS